MGLNLNLGNINKAAKDFTHRRSDVPEETMRDVEVEVIKPILSSRVKSLTRMH